MQGPEARIRARDLAKCPRCEEGQRPGRRTGDRPSPVLGLYPLNVMWAKAGAEPPKPVETKDLPAGTTFTNAEIKEWLGEQASVFDEALTKGLDLLEVYAGSARVTTTVKELGGTAIAIGLAHGQDLGRARDRAMLLHLIQLSKPRHALIAFPCTAFCAWARLAQARSYGNREARLKEGRLHLRFSLDIARLQREAGRHAHLENPLTSLAWQEPAAIQEFAHPAWKRSRLDQCTTGLSGPQGGLHKKPTLIRTTDERMQFQLHRLCAGDHEHELVQGDATALSAMYSPHMAMLIARVVMDEGGGGSCFSASAPSHQRVGVPEARSAPGLPKPLGRKNEKEWWQPLKGELPQHLREKGPLGTPLKEGVAEACKEYLEHVEGHDYCRAAFKRAAELGSQVLERAEGWQEAARSLRKVWISDKGDHFRDLHGDFFEGLVSSELLEKARSNAIHGIQARSTCKEATRVRSNPHPSLKEHLDEAGAQLWKDAQRGRALIVQDKGEPTLEGVVSVPLARVPKMLPNRTVSEKGRVIWDATPINKTCHKERHPPALQPKALRRSEFAHREDGPHGRSDC